MLDATNHFDRLKDSLPGDGSVRTAALAVAEAVGLPNRRVESWHYTDLPRLLKMHNGDALQAVDFMAVDALMAVFDNGVLATLETDAVPQAAVPQADGLNVSPFVNTPPISAEAMAHYNVALAQNGLVADITADLPRPLVITTTGNEAVHLSHKITLADGVKAVLVDNHLLAGYANVVFDISLGVGATLTLVRLQQAGHQIGQSRVSLREAAHYKSVALVTGGMLARHEAEIRLTAAHAHAELHSAILGHDKNHADFTYIIDHQAANTSSHTTAYNVLADAARGVFQGKIIVRPDAQKVDAQMHARAMMLSEGAEMDVKPELEIFADDVACAHGSAIGELDRDALFFLRTRGLDEATARHLLIAGFIEQVLGHIDNPGLVEIVHGLIDSKISGVLRGEEQ